LSYNLQHLRKTIIENAFYTFYFIFIFFVPQQTNPSTIALQQKKSTCRNELSFVPTKTRESNEKLLVLQKSARARRLATLYKHHQHKRRGTARAQTVSLPVVFPPTPTPENPAFFVWEKIDLHYAKQNNKDAGLSPSTPVHLVRPITGSV
jgi:hypothetical protein